MKKNKKKRNKKQNTIITTPIKRSIEKDYSIEIIEYNAEQCSENKVKNLKDYNLEKLADIDEGITRWINIDEQYTEEILNEIRDVFAIHPLTIENIVNDRPRAKVEEYEDYLYIAAKMIYYAGNQLVVEQMNFIMGKNYVISFGEVRGDVFDPIRNRLRNQGTRQRKNGADYLMYTLLDAIVDGYFEVLDVIGEKIDGIEEELIEYSSDDCLHEIRMAKKELLYIRKNFGPLREVISWLSKESSELIEDKVEIYFRDVYDHMVQVIDTAETYRELLSGLMELHISNTSNRLNEIMKVLTIISTIFIPLTFIAGIYGMNFKYMPELSWKWGYGGTWLVMIIISIIMVIFFKRKKWF
ncbi:magnesium/cobalt transporter CorA [Anaeromicropila herbilytica]|uniref:Magnesium transport protein CorA n=1 Tax=Anaeromicropila herbilytica TaxID=2785025 RepID=A0A7R7EIN3_9FIRM|nr:magnesium/cobalt transporter CorA [Anaeromicropila herbilytica]BCN29473.1 cobalt/magnesium transport protein CorA [Anaeromicropila herbilytica]